MQIFGRCYFLWCADQKNLLFLKPCIICVLGLILCDSEDNIKLVAADSIGSIVFNYNGILFLKYYSEKLLLYIFIYIEIYLSIYLSIRMSVCQCIYLSVCQSTCLSLCLSINLSMYLYHIYSCVLVCLHVYVCVCIYVCVCVYSDMYPSSYLSICLSGYLPLPGSGCIDTTIWMHYLDAI